MRKLVLALVCLLLVAILSTTLFACSKNKSPASDNSDSAVEQPSGQQTDANQGDNSGGDVNAGDNGNTGDNTNTNDNPGDDPSGNEPSQKSALQVFAELLENISSQNAKTTMTVSLGGRTLSQRTLEFSRSANGGSVKTTTLSLDVANAKNPYKTEESVQTLDKAEFENAFPLVGHFANEELFKDGNYRLTTVTGQSTLAFTLVKTDAQSAFKLTAQEAGSIATDISVTIVAAETAPSSLVATYKSTSGNTVEIKVEYLNA